jgi:type IV secretory pathway VirB4 component
MPFVFLISAAVSLSLGANCSDFSNGIQNINPLQIDAQYKPFLQSWVKGLLGRNDDDDTKIIANALNECLQP